MLKSTADFDQWLERLRDRIARSLIVARISRARDGNLGKVRSLGSGLNEMKVDHGPGYRLYFTYDGPLLVVLLVGGDKSSRDRDIRKARDLAERKEWRE
jgi:putative addiction module killer protein